MIVMTLEPIFFLFYSNRYIPRHLSIVLCVSALTSLSGTLLQNARGWPVQPWFYDLSPGLRPLHLGPARLRREVQFRGPPENDNDSPTAARPVKPSRIYLLFKSTGTR